MTTTIETSESTAPTSTTTEAPPTTTAPDDDSELTVEGLLQPNDVGIDPSALTNVVGEVAFVGDRDAWESFTPPDAASAVANLSPASLFNDTACSAQPPAPTLVGYRYFSSLVVAAGTGAAVDQRVRVYPDSAGAQAELANAELSRCAGPDGGSASEPQPGRRAMSATAAGRPTTTSPASQSSGTSLSTWSSSPSTVASTWSTRCRQP